MKINNTNNKQEWIDKAKKLIGEYAHCYAFVGDDTMPKKHKELIDHLEFVKLSEYITTELAKPEIEPVAWQNKLKPSEFYEYEQLYPLWYDEFRPLYAEPPKREQLREEEIKEIWFNAGESYTPTFIAYARAIEKAHGIK